MVAKAVSIARELYVGVTVDAVAGAITVHPGDGRRDRCRDRGQGAARGPVPEDAWSRPRSCAATRRAPWRGRPASGRSDGQDRRRPGRAVPGVPEDRRPDRRGEPAGRHAGRGPLGGGRGPGGGRLGPLPPPRDAQGHHWPGSSIRSSGRPSRSASPMWTWTGTSPSSAAAPAWAWPPWTWWASACKPANFLETGGGITEELMYKTTALVLQKPGLRGLLINLYGGINPIHEGAKGIVRVLKEQQVTFPVVAKALGNRQEETWATLTRGRRHHRDRHHHRGGRGRALRRAWRRSNDPWIHEVR
ncbi:MAG: hypothetical protein M0C28_23025 [Candidatus Moduliflexus flocculans]|nr:hypothetical protein [Candidatus Moduliflexus flocculans]